ncbi:MAG: prepilin-type N-terminal cleavage/methylation domain-containing protein [Patescibacteria group bacterium]
MKIKLQKTKRKNTKHFGVFPILNTQYPIPHTRRGFTLIEMIVAVSLFTVVMFVSVGALLAIIDANRKANAIRTTMDNLNFAIGSMARDIRTGTIYACEGAGNCPDGGTSLTFLNQDGNTVRYWHNASSKSIMVDKGGVSLSITSPEIRIETLTFYVSGVGADGIQPRAVMTIKGKTGTKVKIQTELNVQTTVSQRKTEQ